MIDQNIPRRSRSQAVSIRFVKPNVSPSPSLAYILGVLLGDGSTFQYDHHNGVQLGVVDEEFALEFKKELEDIGLHPLFCRTGRGIYRVQAYSLTFVNWYKSLSLYEIGKIISVDEESKRSFLKGFFDSEGSFSIFRKRNYYKGRHYSTTLQWRASIANTKREILEILEQTLKSLSFNSKVYGPYEPRSSSGSISRRYKLDILGGREEVRRFIRFVNSCIPRKSIEHEDHI